MLAKNARLSIDGQPADVPAGTTILEVARRAGVFIPALCHHPALPPDGSCRMCLVEIVGRPGLHPACMVPVLDGMQINTETAAVEAARRNTLRLILGQYRPGVGRTGDELSALAARYGTIGEMALFFSSLKCQHYYDSGHPSATPTV